MIIGGKYQTGWRGKLEQLTYVGRNKSPHGGHRHQFERAEEPGTVWIELRDMDLHKVEKTPDHPVEMLCDDHVWVGVGACPKCEETWKGIAEGAIEPSPQCAQCKKPYRKPVNETGCPKCAPGVVVDETEFRKSIRTLPGPPDYKAWYDEAMCASNAAGFVGFSAAQTIEVLANEIVPQNAEDAARYRDMRKCIQAGDIDPLWAMLLSLICTEGTLDHEAFDNRIDEARELMGLLNPKPTQEKE